MSSFLCFICHSTVNADTNEDMRDKYREVVGMHLCPDSHLCHICCHVLNKLSLFRAVCLKRSLEYPVLFSEKGTLNLQRNDLEFLTLCPEESCGQYYNRNINSKTYNFHCNYEHDINDYNLYQNDLLSNQYVELRDEFFNIEEQMFDSNFNMQLQQNNDENVQSFNDNCVDEYSNTSTDYTQNESENDFGRDLEDIRKENDLEVRKDEYTQMYSCREDELKQFVLYKNSYNCYQKPYENHNYETHINNQINQNCENININNLTLNNLNVYENQNISCVKSNYLLNQQEKHEISNEIMHEFSTHQLTTLQCRNTTSCMELEGNNYKNDNINKSNIVYEIINSNSITKEQNVTNNFQERNLYADSDYCLTELVQTNKNIIQDENVPSFTNTEENHVKIDTVNEITKLHEKLSSNLDSEKSRIDEVDITISQDKNITSFTNLKDNLDKTSNNLEENKTDDQKTIAKSMHNQNDEDESIENQNDEDESIENQNDENESLENQNDEVESTENCSVSPILSEIDEQTNTQSEIDENQLETQEKFNQKQEKGFIKIILTVEEQKAELEANRKDKKYLNAEYKCYNCALGFLFKDTYQAHMMRHEESNGEHKCSLCKLRFASLRVLRAHRASHAQRHQCLTCARTVRGTRRSAHAQICQKKEMATCHLCGKVFQDLSSLQQHLKRLHRATTTRNIKCVCNVCGDTFNNHLALRTHMLNHLTKKFTCPTCPATFSSPYSLNQHTKRHTNPNTDQHYCMTCGLSYTSRKSLLAHQRNALAHQESILECPLCARTCPNQKSLTTHMESVHSNTKNYACTICPNRYTNRKSLVRHLGTHRGKKLVKNAVCHLCGSVFKGTNKLNRHLREVCEKTKLEEELAALYMTSADLGVSGVGTVGRTTPEFILPTPEN